MALTPNKTFTLNGVTVNEYLLKNMYPVGGMNRIVGVTIHNTDWITTASDTTPAEQYTRATANGNMGDVIVHYYVDDKCAWQNLPHNVHGWHAADGQGDGNMQTIAIECIMDGSGSERSKKSEDNAARLCAALLKQLGFGIDRLYSHQHWYSRKYCPAYILPHWDDFVAKVKSYMITTPTANIPAQKKLYRVRKSWTDASSQIGAYKSLDSAKSICKEGYFVFDESGKVVYPEVKEESVVAKTYCNPKVRTLKKGDKGESVKALQIMLMTLGYDIGSTGADSDFGTKTSEAVGKFQKDNKLTVDNVVGADTWSKLIEVI